MRNAALAWSLVAALAGTARAAGQFQQSTDAGFDAGSYSSAYRSGSGASVSVQLDYTGRAAGLAAPGGAAWFNAAWAYRVPVTIQSTNGSTLTNYQVPLTLNTQALISAGRMRADGADMRFTTADGVTPVNFYLLSGLNTASTVVWAQVPSVAASTTTVLYMYYGNASATAASSLSSTFIFGDDFSTPDGTAPDGSKWSGIFTSSTSASLRETRGGQLHYSYGSYTSNGYFGLASLNSLAYSAGRRYRVVINASNAGAGQKSAITLCTQSSDCLSSLGFGSSWISFAVTHSTPAFTVQRAAGSGVVTLVPATNTSAGAHVVELLMKSGSYQVNLDGASVASGAMTTITPYVQLEAGSNSSSQNDYAFGTMFVGQYSTPEPTQAGVGAEQGAYLQAGAYSSAVLDSGVSGTRYHQGNWASAVPGSTGLQFLARAADASIAAGTWTVVSSGADTGLSGRYFQYQSTFTTSDVRFTAAVSSVTFAYTSAPPMPSSLSGTAVSSAAISWSWTDPSAGQFQPDGFRVLTSTGGTLASVSPAVFSWLQSGLTPNTAYQAAAQAFNFVGSSATALITQYTLTPPAAVTPAQSTGTWYGNGTVFAFTNAAGFGPGAVTSYRYQWNTSPSYAFGGSEPAWSAGTLSISTPTSGQYYLHVQPLNAAGAAAASLDVGPFLYDTVPPSVTGFTPSSAPWTSAPASVNVGLSDAGGSGLAGVQYQWLASSGTQPAGGWSSMDTSVNGSSATINRIQFANGSWFLHILVTNIAGATGYAEAGPYQVDVTSPTGSISINGGAAFASTTTVALGLSAADSVSGVMQVRFRNVPGAFTPYELPASTRAWALSGAVGVSTVEYQIVDQASNTVTYQATIFYSRQTGLALANQTIVASGETPAQASTAAPSAVLTAAASGAAIPGESVSFQLLAAVGSAATDGSGAASVSFAAPASSGVYMTSATFNGDASYDASFATATLTVTPRSSFLVTPGFSANAASTVTITVNLIDLATAVGLASKPVDISFQGSTHTVATDASGNASFAFATPASSGTFAYSASYAGGATYGPVSANGNVTIGRRGVLVVGAGATASVNQPFAATATLFDLVSGSRIAGKTMVFAFASSSGTGTTDATGFSSATFAASSTGTIDYVATFPGDATYAAGSDTEAVAVGLRPTTVTPVAVSTTVGSPFAAAATITDQLTGAALPGESVTFTFLAASATLTTDASGYAQTSFTAPASSGSYTFGAAAAAGAANAAANATGGVTVGRRGSATASQNASPGAGAVFTASATLTDFGSGAPLAGAAVYLQFQGSAALTTTDASGLATATFTAPGGVGGYSLAATFLGDGTYLASSSTGTVTVNTRATTLAAVNVSVPAAGVFTASATLTETIGSAPIGGKSIIFRFQAGQQVAVTDGTGLAAITFTAPASTGTFNLNADFAGDALYVAASDTKTVTSTLRPLTIVPSAAAASASSVWTATATVTDGLTGAAVSGLDIRLTFQASTSTALSSALGVAAATFTAPASTGTYSWQASYPGDSTYQATANAGTVVVSARPSQTLLQNISGVTNRVFTASATVTDLSSGNPLSGKTVSFTFQGSTLTATTNGTGLATRTFSAPASSGTYPVTAWFSGDATNASSTGTATATIIRLPVLMAGQDITTTASATFNPQETLTDAGSGAPLSGRTINFAFMTSTMAVVTDANGVAVATFTAPSSSTLTNFTATFAGDATYAPGTDTRVVAVGFRFTVTVPFNTFGLAMDPSTFTAKLIDAQTQGALSGETLSLNIQSATHTAVTDVNGLASSTFTLPSSSGSYAFNGSFGGQGFYTASAATATITVLSRPTIQFGGLSENDFDRFATLGAFNGTWQLEDSNSFLGVAGRTINVYYHSSTTTVVSSYTVVTNGSGNFNLTALNMKTSTFSSTGNLIFVFPGDPTYSSSTLNQGYTVVPRYTDINVDGPTANAGLSFNVGATLHDSGGGGPIAGRVLTFTFQGSTATGTTDGAGHAVASFTAPASTGNFNVTASWAGDTTYGGTGGTGVVTVINRQSLLSAGSWDCGVMLSCTLNSALTDLASGDPIANASVTYHVAAGTYTVMTNASGVTTLVVPPYATTGGRTIFSNFPGNGSFLPAYSTATLPVNLRPTLLGVADLQVQRLDVFTLAAGLQEYFYQPATPVIGATVTFVFNGSTYTAVTDQFGTAAASVTAPSTLGAYPFSASFVGDSTFTAISNAANIIVGKRDTQLSGTNSQPAWGQFFFAVAQLQDGSTPISGATITFVLQGSTQSALTNSLGIATAPFTAPSATGTYTMNLSYAGSALFNASTATASILADRRLTSLGAANLNTSVLSTFTALAALTDQVSGGPLAGSSIAFTYQGSSATALTDGSGVSTASFVAPSTSAALYSANYAGNGLYYPSTSSGTLSISLRQTSLLASNNSAAVSQVFTASSQLLDFATGGPIAGSTVTFTFQGSTKTAPTDGTGAAAVTFTAPAATGTYTFTASYPGGAVYLASTGTASVAVTQRGESLTPSAVTTSEGAVFTAQATFIDSVSGLPVSGATVTFVFNGSTVTALTDASGVATSTFTAPASSGTYTYTASFPGNGTYTPASSNAPVTVGLRTTALIVSNVSVLIGDAWTASAELVDSGSGLPISTRTVSLLVSGSTQTAATNGSGVAAVVYSSRSTAGNVTIFGSFAGDATYAPASGSATLSVSSRTTSVALNLPTAFPGEVLIASATLTDVATGAPISTATVIMTFQASSAAAATNGVGVATAAFAPPASTGTFSLVATFPNAGAYVGSSSTGSVAVVQRPTSLSVSNAAVVLFSSFTASATLADTRLGTGVSGATVSFVFNGATQTVLTNGLGSATTTFAAPAAAGSYALTASFAGSSTLAPASGSGNVNATLRPTLTVGSPLNTTAGSAISATAQIKDASTSASLSGLTLIFQLNGSSQAAVTNGSGQATAAFTAPASSGSYSFSVTYPGGGVYSASSDTEPVAVGQRVVAIVLPNYNSNAQSPFSPVATVTDAALSAPIAGRAVSFVFQGATETATTDGLGAATTNYVSPAGIGTYALTAATLGDATYAAAFASATVTVASFASTITAVNASSFVGQIFIASATVKRSFDLQPLAGSSVVFQLNGTIVVATSNAVGLATAAFNAPLSSGTYGYSATFGGDGTYLGASSTATLTVSPLATTLAAGLNETVPALAVITATATLTRTVGGAPVAAKVVQFAFQGQNAPAITNGSGVATTTFTAISTGTWNYTASFAGDGTNAPSSTAAAITVTGLASVLSEPAITAFTLDVITASATLTSGPAVAGRTVYFWYLGASSASLTNASGLATVTFNAGASSGTPNVVATFPGDATYNASSATNTVTLSPRPTILPSPAATAYANDFVVTSATLTDTRGNVPATGQPVAFSYQGVSSATVTNAIGVAGARYAVGSASGTFTYYSTFTANATYLGSASGATTVTVLPRPTLLASANVTSVANNVYTATATLTDVLTGAPLAGQSVSFLYFGVSSASLTNASGLATVAYNAGPSTGTWSYSVTLASGPTYAGVSSTATVTVGPRPTALAAPSAGSLLANSVFTASATLTDLFAGGTPIAGRAVTFLYLGVSSSSLTNASGLATVTYNVGASSGSYGFSATYLGEPQYGAQSATGTVTVLPRPTSIAAQAAGPVFALTVFTASGTLTDATTLAPISGQTLSFLYQGTPGTGVTNASGLGAAAYNAGTASGTWSYTVSLASGPTYAGVGASASVTVNPRPVNLATQTTTELTLNTFIASATLTDGISGAGISGQIVWFNYGGSWQSAVTSGSGLATKVYSVGASSGGYSYSATFVPTPTYLGQSSTATLTAAPRPTALAAPGAGAYSLGVFTASATLTDVQSGAGVNGKQVTFHYLGSTQTAVTNGLGLATTVYAVGPSSGSYTYSATFAADATYVGVSSTPAVLVRPRPTSIAAPAATGVVLGVFTASGTLTDLVSGGAVSGQTLYFAYGASTGAAVTNGSGFASFPLPAGPSSGTYLYSVTLSSGGSYAGVSSTGTVTVLTRPTLMSANAVASVAANDLFIATATLTDQATGAPVAGRTVTFLYQGGSSSSSLTNASGQATVTYGAGASAGSFTYTATFTGDAAFSAQSATATVTVVRRPTSAAASAASAYANEVYTASSTLTDVELAAPLAGQTLWFAYAGASSTSLTNASGLGTVTYNAGSSSGTYQLNATLPQNAAYATATSSANVTVLPRPTLVAAAAVPTVPTNTVFTASATLTDVRLGSNVPGQTIRFVYGASTGAAVTDGSGLATVLFNSGLSSGTASFSATLSSGPTYSGQSSTASVTVSQRASALASAAIPLVNALNVFTASATLSDVASGAPVSGKTISFVYLGAVQTAVTNGLGTAATNYAAGPSSGSYQYSATFAQDATYVGSSSTSSVLVAARPTLVAAAAVSKPASAVFIASATLTDVLSSSPLAGQTVWFTFGGASSSSLTNASGLATVSYAAPPSSGAYSFSATLSSGPTYAGQSSTATLTVTQRATLLPSAPVPSVYINGVFTATATLSDVWSGAPLPGKTVTFLYLGTSSSSLTNASGVATVSYNAGLSSGTLSYSSTFVGDPAYGAQSSTSSVLVLPRPTSTTVYGVASVYVNAVFNATATVSDLIAGSGVSGQTVHFSYRGSNQNASTNGSGQAFSTYNAGASSGTFSYVATIASGPAYGFSSATATVAVVQRPITVLASPATSYAGTVYVASATLTDGLSGLPVSGSPVTFLYLGTSSTSLTNASGLATVSYGAGASSGAATFSATYVPDSAYSAGSSTANVTVKARPTALAALPVGSTPAIDPFSAAATLTDALTSSPISGQTIWFAYRAGISSAATDGSGTATVSFSAGTSSGTYQFSATLSSGPVYAGVSSSATVTVTPRSTSLSMPAFPPAQTLGVFIASATLIDGTSLAAVSSQTITFVFNGSTVTGLSNGAGLATAAFATPASSGTYPVTAALAANPTYTASFASSTVAMAARTTKLTGAAVSVYATEPFGSTATLTDAQTLGGVAGRELDFLFQASAASGTTNGAGAAAGAYAAPAAAGAYSFSSAFAGDATYAAISTAAAVTVLARPTGLTGAAPASAFANTVFTATATLTDLRAGGTGVAGRAVTMTYRSQSKPAVTNASGVAVATFTAEVTTGTYGLSAVFAGDSLYASSAAVAVAVSVLDRPTSLAASAVPSTYALGVFTATATLTDSISTTPVSGRVVYFAYAGSSGAAVTDGTGGAYMLFAAGSSTGPASFSATFPADATYGASSSTGAVTVAPRPTSTLAAPGTSYASTVFTASATLTDLPSGAPLAGKTLSFVFAGSTRTAATNGSGFASSTFTAPSSSGAYVLSVALSTDAVYVGSASNAEIDVIRKPSVDSMPGAVVQALNVFTASATLTDGLDASPLIGAAVSFVFQGSTQTALTNGLGLATTTFFAPSSAGSYPVTSAFAGDSVHSASAGAASVLVSLRPSAAAAVPATVVAGDVFTATATFTDGQNASPIAAAAVKFFFPSTQTATTDGAGVATSTFTAPLSVGAYAYVAQYAGSSTYFSTSTAGAVTVTPRPATVSISSGAAFVASVFVATATMRDVETGNPVSGRTISFVVGGATVTASTDGSGTAHASLSAPGTAGSYGMTAAFAADATYSGAFSSATLTVVTRPTDLSTAPATAPALDPLTLTATLTDSAGGSPLSGRTVSFVLFGATQTALTNALGQAATTYTAASASATYVFTATFAGDASYSSSTILGSAAVTARPTAMTAKSFTTVANAVFTATGTLRDAESSSALAGKVVQMHFSDGGLGQDALAVTDAFGQAVTTFTAPSGTGLFNYTAKFAGDATYGVSLDTGFVQIGLASTMIAGDISTIELDTFTFSAKLIDPFTQPISGRAVTFSFRGSTQTAVTDAAGVARSTFTAPASSGTYAAAAAFAGDTTYAPSQANVNVNVAQRGTTLSAANAAVLVGSSVTVTARLRDGETSVGVSSKTVIFTVFGSTLGASTDASGQATATFPPAPSSGSFSIAAAFAGDSIYAPAADASTATVSRIPTSPVPLPAAGSPSTIVPLSLKLLALSDGSSLPGQPVIFQLGSATAAATTDATGQASANFSAPPASGTYTFSTLFQGDTTYAASSSSGTLSIGLRATSVSLAAAPAFASAVFAASATLTDTLSAAPVSTETVVFSFNGSTASAVTNGAGVAMVTFSAPASTGSFALGAAFAGDSTFATSTTAAVVPVSARPVAASALPATVPVGGVFLATAAFSDSLSGSPLASAAVGFSFNGATAAAATDALGVATATFAAPASSGTYSLSAAFAGAGLEAPAAASATVTVVQLGSLVTAPPVGAPLNAPFTVSATLLAQSNGAPLTGQSLLFSFQGATASATTDAGGVASATFTAPGVLGVYGATAAYSGGAVYSGASALALVSVSSRPTSIALPGADVSALQVFAATITLTDVPSGLGLGGQTVSFFFQGSTFVAATDGTGVALATFTAPASTGVYALNGLFAGTTVYLSTETFSSVTISSGSGSGGTGGTGGGQGTVLLAGDLATMVSRVFVASATLTLTSGGSAVPNETISFDLNGTTLTAVTNAVGLATVSFTAPATSGTFIMAESFAGDSTFNAAYSTSAVFVQPEPTGLTVPDVLTSSGSVFIATATLTVAASSAPLAARSVAFLFQGTTVSATTNGTGTAFATFLAPSSSGSYTLNATYSGDPTYALATTSASVVVQADGGGGGTTNGNGGGAPVVIQFPAPVTPAVDSQVFTATATLFDPSAGQGVPGRALAFVFQGSTNSGTTDAYGVAHATFMAPASFGPYVLSSYFIGDSTYVAVSATNTVIVGLGLVPADPANLLVTTQTATAIQIAWDPVTLSVNGLAMSSEVVKYAVERSTDLSQGWQSWLSVSSGLPTALSLSTVTVDTWVRVVAVSREGFRSPGLSALHLSSVINPARVFLAPGQDAWVEVPPDADKDLGAGGTRREIVLTTVAAPGYVFAYQISVWDGVAYQKDFTFNGSYNGVSLVVSIDRAAQVAAGTSGLSASSLKRVKDGSGLGLFYWNGVEWVKLGAVQNLQNGQASINLRRTGQFAAGFTTLSSAFELTKVAPRVFTPDSTDPNFNRAIFYYQDPNADEVNVRIFDITGATVRGTIDRMSASQLFWDGKDDGGKVVKGGVYIYQIETGGKKITGTIAVAR